jgi:SpoVK/Ycf46/Vps4 family AAA+-type ATPase
MARGELMKRLLASYGQDAQFRAVAMEIIDEEEKKNNRVLARSLRRTLESAPMPPPSKGPKVLAPLLAFPDRSTEFLERVEQTHKAADIILSAENLRLFVDLLREFRNRDEIRRHGLRPRSKLLFCGPPGCGKTLCAEVFAGEVGLPLYVAKLDVLVSSYLGETASNVRKLFEFARRQPCVLFLDEFDALARARQDTSEHSELRRVVNSLLLFIDRFHNDGFLIAATNLDEALDRAVWRRFDEVVWFEKPNLSAIKRYLKMKFRNVKTEFSVEEKAEALQGYSFAEIERICLQAIKRSILDRRKTVRERDFIIAVREEARRHKRVKGLTIRN